MRREAVPKGSFVAILVVCIALFSWQLSADRVVAASEIKPCQITVLIVETIYAGQECVIFSPVFKMSNPNAQGIYLSSFSYELDVGDFYFSGQQIPVSLYIPSNSEISFVGAVPASWTGMSMWLMQRKGISMAKGMQEVLPLWKAWGAKLFKPELKEAWEKATAHSPDFIFKGEYEISVGDDASSKFSYKANWTM